MLIRLCVLLLTLCTLTTSAEAGLFSRLVGKKERVQRPPTVNILLFHDKPGAVIEIKGPYKMYDPLTNDLVATRFIGKRRYMQHLTDGLQWGEEFPGQHQLAIVPESPYTTIIVDGIEYNGTIMIYGIEGCISAVNVVDIEDYLKLQLPSRFREPLSDELMAAIAIAARTNVYYESLNPPCPYWTVDAQQVGFQGFATMEGNSAIDRALDATRFIVLAYDKGATRDPFPINLQALFSPNVTLPKAEEMAKKGDNAAKMLSQAFPGAALVLDTSCQ